MGLSEAFGTINHRLLLAKLDAYGFSRTSLKLTQNYLCKTQQRISINGSFSDWTVVTTDIVRKGVLSPSFLNHIPSLLPTPPPFFQNCAISPDNTGMGVGVGVGGVSLRLSFERSKERGRRLPKLNKCEQEGRWDPNIGPCVITY